MADVKYGFVKMNISEFEAWLSSIRVARTLFHIQQHHTWRPNYASFVGKNHFELQQSMKQHHIVNNGWKDIGQHFTIFPDGSIMTGRSLEDTPACILGFNANAICIEHLGDFDIGKDKLTTVHQETIVKLTAALCSKFSIVPNSNHIVYHHWFDLSTGVRNNGTRNNKSCPGSNFFGGNKVENFEENFLPLIKKAIQNETPKSQDTLIKYAAVNVNSLNIRVQPNAASAIAKGRSSVKLGAVIRVYEIKDGWYRIATNSQHWVSAKYTIDLACYIVNVDALNLRGGPGATYAKSGTLSRGQEVFSDKETGGWIKIASQNNWVKKDYLLGKTF